jgi:polysaccharide pyruvyl transferase WcaK-like protein
MNKKVYVYGWYGHANLGDEAFKGAFRELWPQVDFTFNCFIPNDINEKYDACFIGGGSFLDQKINKIDRIEIPLGFIGVGLHENPHPDNLSALKKAEVVISRNQIPEALSSSMQFIPTLHEASDLVLSRTFAMPRKLKRKMILIFVNHFVIQNMPNWKRDAYENFLKVFPGVCDDLCDKGYDLVFFPMCLDLINDDRLLAFRIACEMRSDTSKIHIMSTGTEAGLWTLLSAAEYCVSMRYHGFIFSAMAGVPCLGMRSHDKMKSFYESLQSNSVIDYYGVSKETFNQGLDNLDSPKKLLDFTRKEKQKWDCLSAMVAGKFDL